MADPIKANKTYFANGATGMSWFWKMNFANHVYVNISMQYVVYELCFMFVSVKWAIVSGIYLIFFVFVLWDLFWMRFLFAQVILGKYETHQIYKYATNIT